MPKFFLFPLKISSFCIKSQPSPCSSSNSCLSFNSHCRHHLLQEAIHEYLSSIMVHTLIRRPSCVLSGFVCRSSSHILHTLNAIYSLTLQMNLQGRNHVNFSVPSHSWSGMQLALHKCSWTQQTAFPSILFTSLWVLVKVQSSFLLRVTPSNPFYLSGFSSCLTSYTHALNPVLSLGSIAHLHQACLPLSTVSKCTHPHPTQSYFFSWCLNFFPEGPPFLKSFILIFSCSLF